MLIKPAGYNKFLDSVTLIPGPQSLEFEGEIRKTLINNIRPNQVVGSFAFKEVKS